MNRTSSDKLAQSIIDQGASKEIAEYKVKAWRGGLWVALFGGLVALASFGFPVLSFAILKETPATPLLIFAGIGFAGGFLLVFLGAHAASGEAMDRAGVAGNRLAAGIAKAASLIRGGPTPPATRE